MGEQKNLENEGKGWVADPEPKTETEITWIKWDEIGQSIEGTYEKLKENSKYKGKLNVYVKNKDGTLYGAPVPYDLERKLEERTVNELIKIEYIMDEDVGQPKPMKIFKVYHWE